jgi:hypothetical protein
VEPVVSGLIAAILTLFDLDRVFYVPKKGAEKDQTDYTSRPRWGAPRSGAYPLCNRAA